MIKSILLVGMTLFFFSEQVAFAKSNALIPGSGQHFIAVIPPASSTLSITTTTPRKTYPTAGIKILTPGYRIVGKAPSPNGFVLFSVSDTTPAKITLDGPIGSINIRLCLNGTGKTYSCEEYTVSVFSSHVIFLTSRFQQTTGALGGIAGADAFCQNAALTSGNPALQGLSFKALLVTSTRSPCSIVNGRTGCGGAYANDWPLVPGSQYVYADGKTLFNTVNQNGVFDGSNSNLRDDNNEVVFGLFWTGIQSILSNTAATDIVAWAFADMNNAEDGNEYTTNLASCNEFTDGTAATNGSLGLAGETSLTFGVVPGATWGNYLHFNDAQTGQLFNLFSAGLSLPCNENFSIVCVS